MTLMKTDEVFYWNSNSYSLWESWSILRIWTKSFSKNNALLPLCIVLHSEFRLTWEDQTDPQVSNLCFNKFNKNFKSNKNFEIQV